MFGLLRVEISYKFQIKKLCDILLVTILCFHRVPTPVAVVISAAVFALAHLTPGEFPQLFVLGNLNVKISDIPNFNHLTVNLVGISKCSQY